MNDDQKQEYVRKEDVEALVKAEVGKNLRDIVGARRWTRLRTRDLNN